MVDEEEVEEEEGEEEEEGSKKKGKKSKSSAVVPFARNRTKRKVWSEEEVCCFLSRILVSFFLSFFLFIS